MVVTWLRALLFVAGVVVAAGGTAYFTGQFDPWLAEPAAVAVAPTPDQTPETPAVAPEKPAEPARPSRPLSSPKIRPRRTSNRA